MTLPTRTVVGTYKNVLTDAPLAGEVDLHPYPLTWHDTVGHEVRTGGGTVTLVDGQFSEALARTDATGVDPAVGRLWKITERIAGRPERRRFFYVPAGDGSPLDVTQVVVADPGQLTYLPTAGTPGTDGDPGADGAAGASAYEVAVDGGFVGTEEQWLASLVGPPGSQANAEAYTDEALAAEVARADDAYEVAGAAGDAEAAAIADAAGKYARPPAEVFDAVLHGGAVGDGRWVNDASISASGTTLTSPTAGFTSQMVGRKFLLPKAGPTGDTITGTITARLSSTQVTLSVTASTSVSAGAFLWGTDDTAAFRACVDDGTAYALAHSYMFKVYVPPPPAGRFYVVAGALITDGGTLGCAQIPLPIVSGLGPKVTCVWEHAGSSGGLQFWDQLAPNITGATIVSFGVFANQTAQGNVIGADGNPSVIGGPTQPNGFAQGGVFSNFYLDFTGSILVSHSKTGLTYCPLDLSGIANAQVRDTYLGTTGTVGRNDFAGFTAFGDSYSIGLLMPACGNNDMSMIRNVTIGGGFAYGVYATEHTDMVGLRILYCWAGLCPVGNYYGSVGAIHSITGTLISIEACTVLVCVVGKGSGGIGPTMHLRIDTETSTPRFADRNSGNDMGSARGKVELAGSYTRSGLVLDGPPGFDIVEVAGAPTLLTASALVSFLDTLLQVDVTAADAVYTLPTTTSFPAGKSYTFRRADGSGHTATIAAAPGQNIDGASSITLPAQGSVRTLVPVGGVWRVV